MLDHIPFFSNRIAIRQRLLLIPFCHHRRAWSSYRDKALRNKRFLGAEILDFERFTIITGFMGYPHLLTLLAGVADWRESDLFWLGTAGVLDDVSLPDLSTVSSVVMTPELRTAWPGPSLDMLAFPGLPARVVVTVDVPHRETLDWQNAMRQEGADRVEMELYPLRRVYGRPFTAWLVGSDRVGALEREKPLPYEQVCQHFGEAFFRILEQIHET
jgi:hypothetical protein